VDICLRAAAEADPSSAALHPELRAEHEAACARREAAYGHVLGVLRDVLQPSGGSQQQLSAAEREGAQRALLRRAAQSGDLYFHKASAGAACCRCCCCRC
jgi:hypothetical protein